MLDERLIEQQHAQMKFHRILYGILIAFLFIVYCSDTKAATVDYIWVLAGTVVLGAAEGMLSKCVFWNRLSILCSFTFVLYAFYLLMVYRLHNQNIYLTIGLAALMLTFMFEFSYYRGISDTFRNITGLLALMLPTLVCTVLYFAAHGVSVTGFLLLLAYGMVLIFDICLVRLFYFNEHQLTNQMNLLLSELDDMEDSNEELTTFKNRVQKVNEELNLQKVQLGEMNKQIQQSNHELAIQAEILKFINGSFSLDIPAVMDYTIDVIMRVRNAEFCAIYIDRNVCYNKSTITKCICTSNPRLKKVPELERIFQEAPSDEDGHFVINNFPSEQFPAISQTKVVTLLVLPLVLDGEKYGVIVSGSKQEKVFDDYIAFYKIIIPQFNLAIHNIKMYAQMRHIAQTDGLTGIHNRVYFNKLFAEQAKKTVMNQESLTVALFDIDKFKRINDTYGHLVGDEVIKKIAQIAAEHIEDLDLGFICRYGGEEFVIALPNMGIDRALPIIQNLHHEIATTVVEAYGQTVTMNVSIGVSAYPALCDDVNQLIKRADWSMYYAKEHGRGQIKVDGPEVQRN